MSNPFGDPAMQQKRVRLPPLNQENQPFRQDYDGGSGGPYTQQQQQQSISSKPIKSVVFNGPNEEELERKKERLDAPPNHLSSMTHATYLNDAHFRSCYPIGAKVSNFIKQSIRCRTSTRTWIDDLNDEDKLHPESQQISDHEKNELTDKILYIRIIGTSALELDTNVMHPFVRIHILNMTTGCYIQKSNIEENAIYGFESNCVIELKDGNRERKSCELEFITSFATNCCDLRLTGSARAIWNEEIFINESAEYLYNPEVIILFELLDFNPMYLHAKKLDSLDVDYFYKVAWGFLRPFGLAKIHMGTIRLQLYRYVFDTRSLNQTDRKECTPLVYFDFIWPQKENEYNGVLNVLLLPKPKPEFVDVFERSRNVFEIERGDRELKKKFQQVEEKSEEGEKDELTDQDKKNLRRRRFINEVCQIPTKIEYKFASAPLGCYRLTFNRKGNYLAAACTYRSSKTIIKLFDVEQGILFGTLKGHSNLIHDLKFSAGSQYLVSVSSDQLVKVWRIPSHSGETIEEDESDHYLVCSLSHPSYVYAGLFLSEGVQSLIVSACFDSRIRIWKADARKTLVVQQEPIQSEVISSTGNNFDNFDDLLDHRHPNCLVYDGARRLYVGDSLGAIHVYDINVTISSQFIATRISLVLHPEMQGDAINSLCLVPPEVKDLLVHSRDNCLRILELNSSEGKYSEGGQSTGSIVGRFFGTKSQQLSVRSTTSPCGQFVLSGSEDGKPHLWDNLGIVQETDVFQYSLIGPVSDVSWNENYHMLALAGFGDEHPIVVYVQELPENTTLHQYRQLQERLITQTKDKPQQKVDDGNIFAPPPMSMQIAANAQLPASGPFSGAIGGSGGFSGQAASQPNVTNPFQNSSPNRTGPKPF